MWWQRLQLQVCRLARPSPSGWQRQASGFGQVVVVFADAAADDAVAADAGSYCGATLRFASSGTPETARSVGSGTFLGLLLGRIYLSVS